MTPKGSNPRGAAKRFTDAELRADLEEGLKPVEVARKHGVSRQAVSLRVKQLGITTVSAVVAPEESRRYVRRQIDAIEELVDSLAHVRLLRDASDEWLRDPERPERYAIGERAEEIDVIYVDESGEKPVRKKARLSRLLAEAQKHPDVARIVKAESRYADPRQLILSTCAEARQTVSAAVDLAKFLVDAKRMEEFKEEMLTAIAEVAPEVRDRIVERLRSRLVLHAASGIVRRPDALPL